MNPLRYLQGYPESVQQQALALLDANRLGDLLRKHYPRRHQVRSDAALYDYVMTLKKRHMRQSAPLSKVIYDEKVCAEQHALGTHTRISRIQGSKLKEKKEIRIDARFRDMPPEFLRMICVHELAHLKESDHNRAFYNLCQHMEPDYFRLELDLRLYLTQLDRYGPP